jgi:hypothetical protein
VNGSTSNGIAATHRTRNSWNEAPSHPFPYFNPTALERIKPHSKVGKSKQWEVNQTKIDAPQLGLKHETQ